LPDGGPGADTQPPPLDPGKWRRPYRVGGWRVLGATLLLALCPMLLFGALLSFLADGTTRASVAFAIGLAIVFSALRLLRMGVWVSSHGIRRVAFWWTRTVRWNDVESVHVGQVPVKVLGTPRRVNGQAVTVTRRGGAALEEVLSDHNADFRGKDRAEDFEAAVSALAEWFQQSTGRRVTGRAV
jgi:hypothetical protein